MCRIIILILAAGLIGSSASFASDAKTRLPDAVFWLQSFDKEINSRKAVAQSSSLTQYAADMVCCEEQYDCNQGGSCRTSYAWMPDYACKKVYNGTESSASNCGK